MVTVGNGIITMEVSIFVKESQTCNLLKLVFEKGTEYFDQQ